jgi:CRISPR/Cas system-associated exonuclease Cas4 (RecB family)
MTKVIDYHIIQVTGSMQLGMAVHKAMEGGWTPLGGVAHSGAQFSQAMVKYDRTQEDLVAEQINDIHSAMVIELPQHIQNWNDHMSYPRSVTISKG